MKEDADKVCSKVQRTFDSAGGKLARSFLLQRTQKHKVRRTTLKTLEPYSEGSTTNSKCATVMKVELSRF